MTRDEAIARVLADIRAIPHADPDPAAYPGTAPSACCAGDYAAYQRHIWHKEEPCEASRAANRAYGAAYRAAHPGYFREANRRWRAKQKGKRAAAEGGPGA